MFDHSRDFVSAEAAPAVEIRSASASTALDPVFIVGAQRSGTTMLRLMLDQHSGLSIPFESGFIVHFHQRLQDYGDLSARANARRLLDAITQYPMIAVGRWIEDPEAILANPIRTYSDLVHAIFLTYARSH